MHRAFSGAHMKNASYKTNQTDSLQMETKVWSQLRSDLILCLSSDSMHSHPEIPHKPHLLSIWPDSHAIQHRRGARPALQRQQSPALEHFYGEKWGRLWEEHKWKMSLKRWYMEKKLWNDTSEVVISYWFGVNLSFKCPCLSMNVCFGDFFQMMGYMVITWLRRCFAML